MVGIVENIRGGATSVIDHQYVHTEPGNDDGVFRAVAGGDMDEACAVFGGNIFSKDDFIGIFFSRILIDKWMLIAKTF